MNPSKLKAALKSKGNRLGLVAVLVALALIIFCAFFILQPQRSISAYCANFNQQKAILAQNAVGQTYSVAVFPTRSSNAHDFASAFTNLEAVAPNDIQPDIRTLRLAFEKIDSDPSQAIAASLGAVGAESSVKQWTIAHCPGTISQ